MCYVMLYDVMICLCVNEQLNPTIIYVTFWSVGDHNMIIGIIKLYKLYLNLITYNTHLTVRKEK
jgi:hypothetical protein